MALAVMDDAPSARADRLLFSKRSSVTGRLRCFARVQVPSRAVGQAMKLLLPTTAYSPAPLCLLTQATSCSSFPGQVDYPR